MINRRDFVRNTALGLASFAVCKGPDLAFANPYGLPIGLELYTVRRQMNKDPEGTVKRLAEIGYREVEFDFVNLRNFAGLLQQSGLAALSAHFSFGAVKPVWPEEVSRAMAIGLKYMVVGFIEAANRQSLDDYKKIAQIFNKAGQESQIGGSQFCYHNHNFEFTKLDGGIGYDVLLKETDPKLVKFELDCFWMIHAGHDPVEYMQKYPGRFPLLHIKDLKKGIPNSTDFTNPNGNPFAEVGKGVIDWKRIFVAAKQSGLEHYFVEQDECDIPPLEAVKVSYDYLHNLTV